MRGRHIKNRDGHEGHGRLVAVNVRIGATDRQEAAAALPRSATNPVVQVHRSNRTRRSGAARSSSPFMVAHRRLIWLADGT